MNWYKIIGFVLLLLGIGTYAQEKENDWEKQKLKGKVKSVSEVKYTTKGRHIEEKSKTIEFYNLKGYRIEEYWLNIKYGNSEKTTYIYDIKNNVIERNYYNSERKQDERTTYSYDEKGNFVEGKQYNTNGKLIGDFKRLSLDTGINILSGLKYTYRYDEIGNWIEKTYYSKNEKPYYIIKREIEYYK